MTSTTIPPSADDDNLDAHDWLTVVGLVVLTFAVFANGLRGEFILDDHKQIARNDLIRIPKFWPKALTSDIWAFKGERDTPWSNYWRPGHVAWLIANYQLFGPEPLGWHLTNLLAHCGVVACAYVVLRWLRAARGVAAAIVALFAVHPTRAESVTWIAGVHDVLAALWQLLALICLLSLWRRERSAEPLDMWQTAWRWTAAIVFYALAVTTKEIAIFFALIVAIVRYTEAQPNESRDRLRRAVMPALPFAGIAIAFLVARRLVLGGTQLQFDWQPSLTSVLASVPLVVMFYLRQILFPYWVSWSYPVRIVDAQHMNLWTFWLPLAGLIVIASLARRFVRGRLPVIGAAIFCLTLMPALNLKGFLPEDLVKDRFLYLPLLGFLMIVVPLARNALRGALGSAGGAVGAALCTIAVLALSVRTYQYNFAWRDEVTFWEHAVRSDPTSAASHGRLGFAYMEAGRLDAARQAMDRSIEIQPTIATLTTRAELSIKQRRYEDAVKDCQALLEKRPDDFHALERLAMARRHQGRLDEAVETFRRARQAAPFRAAAFTDQLAVVLYEQGKRDEALRELESARAQAETEFSPAARMVLFHLGMLYMELGRRDDGATTLRRFLALTEGSGDQNIVTARRNAQRALEHGTSRQP